MGDSLPPEALRAVVCERMGWTFRDYDEMDWLDLVDLLAVWDGKAKAEQSARSLSEFQQKAKARER